VDLKVATETVPQRRRGAALEGALLNAAWEELLEHGYAGFTYDGVANRAGTSRPVVYRRWPTKPDLLLATLQHQRLSRPLRVPDTGSLRGDLVGLLLDVSRKRTGVVALAGVGLTAYFEETGSSFADIRAELTASTPPVIEPVLARAVARGEIDPGKLTDRIKELPLELVRHEMLMTLRPVPRKHIEEIVDTIFLPLVSFDRTP
jgi:AcrR family transcriptional regulator